MQPSSSPTIAVFGASGHTGRFVIAELLARGLTPVAIGRDADKLVAAVRRTPHVETRTGSVDAPATLDRAFAGVELVVNCAGPFLDTADAVASAALRVGAHYIDITAEQASASTTLDRFGALARDVGVVVMPAMGFYGGLADLVLTAAATRTELGDVTVAIALDSWHPTQGTRLTGARNTVPRVVIRDGQLVALPQPAQGSSWLFPPPFGSQEVTEIAFSEVPLIARHLDVTNLTTLLNDTPLHDLRDPTTPPPEPVDDSGRSAQRFVVDVEIRRGPTTTRATVAGRDIYAVTAPLVVGAAEQIVNGERSVGGAFAPGELLDAHRLLESISPAHLHIEIGDTPTIRPPRLRCS